MPSAEELPISAADSYTRLVRLSESGLIKLVSQLANGNLNHVKKAVHAVHNGPIPTIVVELSAVF